MKAMILAAGLGTRLGPLSRTRPKALAELNGRTLLEITLRRLRHFGITQVIINVHHFADMVIDYLRANHDFGMQIAISREEELLDTGGGLKKAAPFFLGSCAGAPYLPSFGRCGIENDHASSLPDSGRCGNGTPDQTKESQSIPDEPFVLHNVDVLSNIDLAEMARAHVAHGALATLAVQHRETSRSLLFDSQLELCGRRVGDAPPEMVRSTPADPLAFAGIHILSPRIFHLMNHAHLISNRQEMDNAGANNAAAGSNKLSAPGTASAAASVAAQTQAFPIIPEYLRLAAAGEKIVGFRADAYYWRDLGTPSSLAQAAEDVRQQLVNL
jgi:NDP-sugar pyrophosphorylase family protein